MPNRLVVKKLGYTTGLQGRCISLSVKTFRLSPSYRVDTASADGHRLKTVNQHLRRLSIVTSRVGPHWSKQRAGC